jgi:hypothetical protein
VHVGKSIPSKRKIRLGITLITNDIHSFLKGLKFSDGNRKSLRDASSRIIL